MGFQLTMSPSSGVQQRTGGCLWSRLRVLKGARQVSHQEAVPTVRPKGMSIYQ